ncbi:hypothetical protein HR060_12780 [Catenovulum sp. SM1970]|uniref:hypothetical protein n=1 Tax=Marinifaba aquimaris TaxID=2741323 RepID=UPI001572CDDC|nr:hypothetical protein [Marinifaba aquimaris]NTS77736.1 hypothetical protein [Marinifaba aquimaris]
MENTKGLNNEWLLQQKQFDEYEKLSLIIKLVAICSVIALYASSASIFLCCAVLAILWGQDAIWKTFQARIEQRLSTIEAAIKAGDDSAHAFQFNTHFAENRASTIGLVLEYVKSALKPTVAYPYAPLIIISLLFI